jgi:hypothetical protein
MNKYENKEVEYNFCYKMIFSFNCPKVCICCFQIPIIYYEVHMHFHGFNNVPHYSPHVILNLANAPSFEIFNVNGDTPQFK